jgi:hypothetical protein
MMARFSLYSSPSSRIVPSALFPVVYCRLAGDILVQFRGMFDRLLQDDTPLVRRASAHILPELAMVLGSSGTPWILQMLDRVSSDSSNLVRFYGAKAIAAIGQALQTLLTEENLRLTRCQLLPMINALVTDSDWQVRTEIVSSMPALCHAMGADLIDVVVDHYVGLAKDVNMEVRVAAAKSGFALGNALIRLARGKATDESVVDASDDYSLFGVHPTDNLDKLKIHEEGLQTEEKYYISIKRAHAKISQSILPALFSLSKDPCVSVRKGVASSLGAGIALMRVKRAIQALPMVSQLMNDKDPSVRQAIVEELARNCSLLPAEIMGLLVASIETLAKGTAWRTRLLAIESIHAWSKSTEGPLKSPSMIPGICLVLLKDPVSEVRLASAKVLPELVHICGPEWLSTTALVHVMSLMDGSFQQQVVGLHAIGTLVQGCPMPSEQIERLTRRVLLAATQSTTINIRCIAWHILALMIQHAHIDTKTMETIATASKTTLETETDADVQKEIATLTKMLPVSQA